jgi:hypothetical protein
MTDNLADIIQLIHLGSRDGTLTVERNIGGMIEEGYIVFVNGAVVDARAGQYSGLAAFNYLNTWRTCRFSFLSGSATMRPLTGASVPGPGNGANGTSTANPSSARITASMPDGVASTFDKGLVPPYNFPVRLQPGEQTVQYLETAQIPRVHRRLLLLVNGQRSTQELARLMGRSLAEVQVLLDDLERAGLIRQ